MGDAVDAIQATARKVGLPDTIQTFFAGTAQAYQDSLRNEPILIAAALVTVYIVLGMLYESCMASHHDSFHAAIGGRGRDAGACCCRTPI